MGSQRLVIAPAVLKTIDSFGFMQMKKRSLLRNRTKRAEAHAQLLETEHHQLKGGQPEETA